MSAALRIAILARGGAGWIGGTEYTRNLITASVEAAGAEGLPIELNVVHDGKVPQLASETVARVRFTRLESAHTPERLGSIKSFFRATEMNSPLARTLAKLKPDFVFPVARLPASLGVAWAEWIPDLQHCTHPEYFRPAELKARDSAYQTAAQEANCVVFSSSTVQAQFIERGFQDKASLAVLPFRVDIGRDYVRGPASDVIGKYCLPERFLLVCNQFWKHKNHRAVFFALREACVRDPGIQIVCTGALRDYRDEGFLDECMQQISALGIHAHIRLLGVVPKCDQLDLMRLACAVIQPSYSEGWSTIVEEARCLGVKLLLSDIAVHREQCAPDSTYFDPDDTVALSELMLQAFSAGLQRASVEELDGKWCEYRKLFAGFGSSFLAISQRLAGAG